jgi:hypothetical protein
MRVSSPWLDEIPEAAAFARILLPDAQHIVSYHIVKEGGCWAAVRGRQPMRLEAGDVFVVPHGDPYNMASDPGLRNGMSGDAVLDFFRHMATQSGPLEVAEGGGGPQRAHIVCGFLGCDIRPFNPVLEPGVQGIGGHLPGGLATDRLESGMKMWPPRAEGRRQAFSLLPFAFSLSPRSHAPDVHHRIAAPRPPGL